MNMHCFNHISDKHANNENDDNSNENDNSDNHGFQGSTRLEIKRKLHISQQHQQESEIKHPRKQVHFVFIKILSG